MNQVFKYIIYQIKHKQFPHCYIGATKDLNARLAVHRTYCNQGKKRHLYNTMRLNGGWEGYVVIVLEEFVCVSRQDAETREHHWIKQFEPKMELLNTYKRTCTKSTAYSANREKRLLYSRLHYYKNRETILAKMKAKYEEGATHPVRAEGEL